MSEREKLIAFINEKFAGEGRVYTALDGVYFYRSSELSEFRAGIYTPSICVALQGEKTIKLGEETLRYDSENFILCASHIPVSAAVSAAPFLSARVSFELSQILDAAREIGADFRARKASSLYIGALDESVLAPLSRIIYALDKPESAGTALAKLAKKELLYALLLSPARDYLLQFANADTMERKISEAASAIRERFADNINMRALAREIGISASSLYHNFRKITRLSPVEFQKRVRLEEAKFMMISGGASASDAAFAVGYASGSQFSRDFVKAFGAPPKTYALRERNLQN